MAKAIDESRMAIIFALTKTGVNLITVECRADYTVTSEDLSVTRSLSPTLTPPQETAVKAFGTSILAQIKAVESIT